MSRGRDVFKSPQGCSGTHPVGKDESSRPVDSALYVRQSDQIEIDRIRLCRGSPGKRPERAMWGKKDWQQFFEISTKRPWNRRRPPRPVYSVETNRITPAVGFSLSELDDAGINIDQAETFGLPVDAARIGAYGPNVSALREFARSARRPA